MNWVTFEMQADFCKKEIMNTELFFVSVRANLVGLGIGMLYENHSV